MIDQTGLWKIMEDINPTAKSTKYSTTAKAFHWGFVILFIYGLSKQVDDPNVGH
jgi:hypothetical protein